MIFPYLCVQHQKVKLTANCFWCLLSRVIFKAECFLPIGNYPNSNQSARNKIHFVIFGQFQSADASVITFTDAFVHQYD